MTAGCGSAWPHSLFGRVMLILVIGLFAAQTLTFWLVMTERGEAMRAMMIPYVAADVASSVAMLDRLPAPERAEWLPRLQRQNYRLSLSADADADADAGAGAGAGAGPSADAQRPARAVDAAVLAEPIAAALARALGQPVAILPGASPEVAWRLGLVLADGAPVAVDVMAPRWRLSPWVVASLLIQGLALAGVAWLAVRQVTRPLQRLAAAAASLYPADPAAAAAATGPAVATGAAAAGRATLAEPLLPETGPREVVEAAVAFNRMQGRITANLNERSQMLGAIAHDLQTPITRLSLRADLVDDADLRERLLADLDQMRHLVDQGLSYARSAEADQEARVATDLEALMQSLVADYDDAGRAVRWLAEPTVRDWTVATRPRALRRILSNLVDNALKFAGAAEVALTWQDSGPVIEILDRGPGIAAAERARVTEPFYRVDEARDPGRGGTGLGLAIVERLAAPCAARFELASRAGGGLVALVRFQRAAGDERVSVTRVISDGAPSRIGGPQ